MGTRIFLTKTGRADHSQDPNSTSTANVCQFSISFWVGEVNPYQGNLVSLAKGVKSWKLQSEAIKFLSRPRSP